MNKKELLAICRSNKIKYKGFSKYRKRKEELENFINQCNISKEGIIAEETTEKNMNKPKGFLCSKKGFEYEMKIYNTIKEYKIGDHFFNTQKQNELGGSKHVNDIICNFSNIKFGIEIKKYNSPDWGQCCLKFNAKTKNWCPKNDNTFFKNLVQDKNIFNNKIPIFF